MNGVLAPTAQLSLGIYKNTDLKVRYLPEISSNDTKIKAFGVGVMHDVKQHIPGIGILPFDLLCSRSVYTYHRINLSRKHVCQARWRSASSGNGHRNLMVGSTRH